MRDVCYNNESQFKCKNMTTIIFSHPWQGSFNRAILDGIEKKLRDEKRLFQVINLVDDGFNTNIKDIKIEQIKNLFNHIVKLYDNLTGSSLSSILKYSEADEILYMWKTTSTSYAARNIITSSKPKIGDNEIDIVGIYYMDANGDFDIYRDETKNYTGDISVEELEKIKCTWTDNNTVDGNPHTGEDEFVLEISEESKDEEGTVIPATLLVAEDADIVIHDAF